MKTPFAASLLVILAISMTARAAELSIAHEDTAGAVKLVLGNSIADIYADAKEAKLTGIAAGLLAEDVQRVAGKKPRILNDPAQLGANAIIVGTIGNSALVDQLIFSGKVDVSDIKGQWESYKLQVVDKPLPNVASALVIIGSDRRGTAYGIFTLSEAIGVSPWYWWADVTPLHQDALVVKPVTIKVGPPSVKYRGIFINDEDWGMQPWSAKTLEPETGDIGPKTYSKMFELLLRLKANFLWPAMHPSTKAFNIYPQDKFIADNYGIVMGSSHCEPMLRNNVSEWGQARAASYNYVTNRDGVLDYWRQRVQENGKFENVYTLGMRGIHDSDMAGGGTRPERVARLNSIIADQRKMLADLVNPKVSEIPQIFCVYKEVLLLYQAGAVPPEDVSLVWADDNHGYIRQLATPAEQKRSGGSGVYYHISYWGRPHDYLWLCSTPPALIWEELSKAYDYDSRTLWVVNVGDLKPAEIGITMAMDMASNISRYNQSNVQTFLHDFAAKTFGAANATQIAEVLSEYYALNNQRKPEHMGFNRSQDPATKAVRTDFTAINYGDENQKRLLRFQELRARTDELYSRMPAEQKDAFYELVVYPVRGSALLNEMVLNTDLNQLYATQGRASSNMHAERAKSAYEQIQKETAYYNDTLAGGKWKNMMTSNPRRQPVFALQALASVTPKETGELGVAIEGRAEPLAAGASDASLPLSSAVSPRHFIDLFNRGSKPVQWTATSSTPWITLAKTSGSLNLDERLWIEVDPAKADQATTGSVTIRSGDQQYAVTVRVRPTLDKMSNPVPLGGSTAERAAFVEADGYLSIAAERFTRKVDQSGGSWQTIKGLGRVEDSIAVFPTTTPSVPNPADLMSKAPRVEYDFYAYTPADAAKITIQAVPTHRINPERSLKYAVAIDDQPPQLIDLESPEFSNLWDTNVLRAAAFGSTAHPITAGKHTLRIFMVDPGVVLDHVTIDLGGLKPSYLPPPETVALKQ